MGPTVENCVDADNFTQRVEIKAYELFASRGYVHGHDWLDWFEAQKLVEDEMNTVDRDCIRSESFYKTSHQANPLPSEIDPKEKDTYSFQ